MRYKSTPSATKPVRVPRLRQYALEAMALLAALAAVLPGQPAGAAEDKTSLPVSIFCAAYAADLNTVFVKNAADDYEKVSLSTANVIEVPCKALVEEGRILLYGPAGEDGKRPVIANAEVAGILQPLIVLNPAAEAGSLAYDSKAVEADLEKFPLGSFSLVNLSPHVVRVIHDDETIELEGSGWRVFTPGHAAGENLAVRMDYKNGEDWMPLSSGRWASRDDRRSLVCFQFDHTSKRMSVKSIPLRGKPSR